jgi:uncharacterized ion transporter superfamily protein YfcC
VPVTVLIYSLAVIIWCVFGVAPWLSALYFAFGVVVGVLAEIAAKDREPSVRSSVSGTPAPS